MYYILITWSAVELVLLVLFVPETYVPYLLKKRRKCYAKMREIYAILPLSKSFNRGY